MPHLGRPNNLSNKVSSLFFLLFFFYTLQLVHYKEEVSITVHFITSVMGQNADKTNDTGSPKGRPFPKMTSLLSQDTATAKGMGCISLHIIFLPGLNWTFAPVSDWIFLIISPPLPMTRPTAWRGTGIWNKQRHVQTDNDNAGTELSARRQQKIG